MVTAVLWDFPVRKSDSVCRFENGGGHIGKIEKLGFLNIEIIIKGVGSARDSSIKSLANQGFNILSIKDVTPIPHNGQDRQK